MRSMDDYDYEVQLIERETLKVGILFSFKSMTLIIDRFINETREITDKYPKSELMKIWVCDMGMLFIFFLFSYNAAMIATLPFIAFYGFVLIKLKKAWSEFHYKMSQYHLMTIIGLIVEISLAVFIQTLVMK